MTNIFNNGIIIIVNKKEVITMKKMYNTKPIKNKKIIIHLDAPKVRIQMTTCKSGVYSRFDKIVKKNEKKLKNSLKRLDIDNLM